MDAKSLAQVQQIGTAAVVSLREEMQASAAEIKGHTGVLIEDLHHKLELVVEGLQFVRQSVVDVRAEITHESRETRALLKLSYEQLHLRVETLEHDVVRLTHRLGNSG